MTLCNEDLPPIYRLLQNKGGNSVLIAGRTISDELKLHPKRVGLSSRTNFLALRTVHCQVACQGGSVFKNCTYLRTR